MLVEKLVGVVLVVVVVLAENEIFKALFVVDNRQGVHFVVPDDVVGLVKVDAFLAHHQFLERSHYVLDFGVEGCARGTVVAAGNHAEELAVGGAVVGDAYGGESCAFLQINHITQSVFGSEVGVAHHKTGFVFLHLAHHLGLTFDGL